MTNVRTIWIGLLAAWLLTACAFSANDAPPPGGEAQPAAEPTQLPGMPDRPATAEEARMGYYRNDAPEAIATTGRPQLVVFWAPNNEESVCVSCDPMRPVLHNIEAEYWDRVDVVYLNFNLPENEPGLAYFGMQDRPGMYIFFIDENGETIRRYYTGFRHLPEEIDFRFTFDRYLNGDL